KAGSTVEYMIKYHYLRPDSWQLGWPGLEFMADYYGKANDGSLLPNKLVVKLPAGLSLQEIGGRTDNPYTEDPVTHIKTYEFDLDWIAAVDKSFFTTIKVYVENNGTEDSVNQNPGYVFPADAFTFISSFEIVDRQNQAPSYVVDTYTQTVSVAPQPIETYSPDVWAAKKSNLEAKLQDVGGTQMAVFTWDIAVGLLNEGVTLLPGNIAPSFEFVENYYSRKGREYVESITLTDSFLTMLSLGDNNVTDRVDKFVIQKYTGSSTLGTEYDMTQNPSPVIWGSGAVSALEMDQVKSIDSDGDEQADTWTPIYTKYRVTVAFEVEDDWIAHFPLIDGYDLTSTNDVTMNATFANLDPQECHSSAEESVELPVTPPAKFTIIKQFTDYNGNEFDYDTDPRTPKNYSSNYGEIQYTISAPENFIIYQKSGTEYTPVMQGASSYTISSHQEYYLLPGLTYTISESLTDAQRTVMRQTEPAASFTYAAEAGDDETFTFKNEETVGKIVIYKKDDLGAELANAWFELYPEGSTEYIVRDKTNGVGVLTLQRIPYGNYILHEAEAPSGYAPNFEDMPITVDDDHQLYE
ncbi:MAG: hypothetical protein IKI54_01730, partial [Lachnospiraceae bacterium]|nr:hypothetical protein [Lachnospiraceae bacterium]